MPEIAAMGRVSFGMAVFHSDAISKSRSLPNTHSTVQYDQTVTTPETGHSHTNGLSENGNANELNVRRFPTQH